MTLRQNSISLLICSFYFLSSSAGLGSSSGPPIPESRLGEENKGHQMLVKMGKMLFWSLAQGGKQNQAPSSQTQLINACS